MQFIYEYICLFVYMHWSSSKEEEEEEEKRRREWRIYFEWKYSPILDGKRIRSWLLAKLIDNEDKRDRTGRDEKRKEDGPRQTLLLGIPQLNPRLFFSFSRELSLRFVHPLHPSSPSSLSFSLSFHSFCPVAKSKLHSARYYLFVFE